MEIWNLRYQRRGRSYKAEEYISLHQVYIAKNYRIDTYYKIIYRIEVRSAFYFRATLLQVDRQTSSSGFKLAARCEKLISRQTDEVTS